MGLDVNGWRDHVARNWTVIPGEEERVGGVHFGSAGPLTSVVRVGDDRTGRWIGGFPADIAPHGRGGGWGEIGDESRRLSVRDLVEGRTGEPQHLAAAIPDLARGAGHTVLAIEDSLETTELAQERLLAGLAEARTKNPSLVWRTVLAVLYAIDCALIRDECTVGIVSHASSGLSLQRLRVRRAGALRGVLAPERRSTASVFAKPLGLRELVASARRHAIGDEGYNARTAHLALAKSAGRLALGLPCEPEIVRLRNGDWQAVTLDEGAAPPVEVQDSPATGLEDCDQIFLETITEGHARSRIESLLAGLGFEGLQTLPPDAVAHGALVAAQRMADGDPVYFDFLPRISTIVVGGGVAQNFDLIDESETLEAGKVYRSPRPATLAIPKGFDEISIYLRKDAEPHPRKAFVRLDTALAQDTPVSVWVEQKPASGRARIVMEAPTLSRNFTIDWENAEEDQREWTEIIASFDTPPPAIPDRLVLKCGMHPWHDSPRAPGLFSLLDEVQETGVFDWQVLARKAAARPFQEYCVSSDGDVPSGVPVSAVSQLDATTRAAVEATSARLREAESKSRDNSALQFLTWQFRRCPDEVSEWLTACIEDHAGMVGTHPFIWHQNNWVLIYQGVARTAQDTEIEERVLRAILRRDSGSWNYRAESACVSLLLSRSVTAPLLLTREDVEIIGRRAILEFKEALGSPYTRFNYAPFLVGGLIRWRLKEPRALLAGRDPLADSLVAAIAKAHEDLSTRSHVDAAFKKKREKYVPILKGLLDYLEGESGNPNLLLDIYDA
ncbi:hypothetical protein K3720_13790 [Leisingera caerulea]|uniref:hypothetical protein n=1 Tax=Leisingera caerulea TaxID=506591 RepID=UPI0021A37E3F|nr:hypothetical protein [Leisingera caerulea]UWQ48985.1 hypothetical protein K3720_13790 [Leisingera caerulea]